jgi:hypothetical protein
VVSFSSSLSPTSQQYASHSFTVTRDIVIASVPV